MEKIDVRTEVERAVQAQWADFAAGHPHLAAVLSQEVLVESATAALAADPAYQQAIAEAGSTGGIDAAVVDVVRQLVGVFLARLTG